MPEDDSPETDRSEAASPWPSRPPRRRSRRQDDKPFSTQEPTSLPVDTPAEPDSQRSSPSGSQPNNPLHGVKLADILEYLVEEYGWEGLSARIDVRCFSIEPSIKSSLKFLRRTQWARDKVERLYLRTIRKRSRG